MYVRKLIKDTLAYDFIKNSIEWPNIISSRVTNEILVKGTIVTYLPEDFRIEGIHSYKSSFGFSLHANRCCLLEFATKFLALRRENCIVIEDPITRPTDGFLEKESSNWMQYENNVITLIFCKNSFDIKCFSSSFFSKAYLTKKFDSFSYERSASLKIEDIDYFGSNIDYIVVPAFDMEGFLIWCRDGVNLSII